MEEQKNKTAEQKTVPDITDKANPEKTDPEKTNPENSKGGFVGWMDSIPSRSCIVMAVAGAYLIYLGYNLISGVMKGEEGSSMGFAIGGGAFILIGAAMLLVGGRGMMRSSKEKMKEAASDLKEQSPARPETKMSISERAALANKLTPQETDDEENKGM